MHDLEFRCVEQNNGKRFLGSGIRGAIRSSNCTLLPTQKQCSSLPLETTNILTFAMIVVARQDSYSGMWSKIMFRKLEFENPGTVFFNFENVS